jgi:hypothetical protein
MEREPATSRSLTQPHTSVVEGDESASLSPHQLTAIEHLLAGETVTAAAAAARVTRETLHRWRRTDRQFIVTLESRRAELRESFRARLLSIAWRALANVALAVDQGDVRTSILVLRGTGLLAGAPLLDSLGRAEVAVIADQLGGILARHVTDPEQLRNIEREIRSLGGCADSL